MIPKYTIEEFESARSRDKLMCECELCHQDFSSLKSVIMRSLKASDGYTTRNSYCSKECSNKSKRRTIEVCCANCDTDITKTLGQFNKSSNHFCNRSCAATYNNKHKTHGTRRSKLEVWLEEKLSIKYPNLLIDYNKKSSIGSELDIYIPSLNLAIELNGIFHYEPIYGVDKLEKIQTNDISKSKACHDNKIDLCVIDTSHQNRFTEKSSVEFLDIISNIIETR